MRTDLPPTRDCTLRGVRTLGLRVHRKRDFPDLGSWEELL